MHMSMYVCWWGGALYVIVYALEILEGFITNLYQWLPPGSRMVKGGGRRELSTCYVCVHFLNKGKILLV